MSESVRFIAFVRPIAHGGEEGPILFAEGPIVEDIAMVGSDISDICALPASERTGLVVFEGAQKGTSGPDPDFWYEGEWRRASERECLFLRFGQNPLEDR